MNTKFLTEKSRVLLAVSGGVDSMVMLRRFYDLQKTVPFVMEAVTVDHCLRKNSAEDARFVKEFCETLGIPCRVERADVPTYCKEHRVSAETGARILRYEILQRNATDFDWVCLAHQADDQAETVLMHLLRGSGPDGAEGMAPVSGKFVRPLLDTSRAEILNYAKEHHVPYRTDESNADVAFTRNRLRVQALPVLKQCNRKAVENLCRFAESMRLQNAAFDAMLPQNIVCVTAEGVVCSAEAFRLPEAAAYRCFKKAWNALGYYENLERKHLQALFRLGSAETGKKIRLPFDITAARDYNGIVFYCERAVPPYEIAFREGRLPFLDGNVSVVPSGEGLRFDADKLPQGCVLRNRRAGDVFRKFGGGTKKLNDYLTDCKVPVRVRDSLPLVAKGTRVFIVVGREISEDLKTDERTKNERRIRWEGEK